MVINHKVSFSLVFFFWVTNKILESLKQNSNVNTDNFGFLLMLFANVISLYTPSNKEAGS
jgi:hypothetical protein